MSHSCHIPQVRDLCIDAPTLLADQEVLELLRQWGREGKVCNMRVERLFAQIKHATPGKAPHLERYLAAGTLCQWLRDHRAGGGRDTKAPHAKDLLADGTPLVGARARRKRARNRRPRLAFANECVSQEKRRRRASGDTPLTHADMAAIKRQAMEEYKALPAEATFMAKKTWVCLRLRRSRPGKARTFCGACERAECGAPGVDQRIDL